MHLGRNLKILLFFSLLYFLTCYAIAHHWYVSGYFSVYDVFFDTDPNKNISVFAHGWARDTLIHPILKLFSIVTRLIEHIISSVFYISEPKVFREKMTLAISPFFSSLSIICFYFLWNILHSEESNTLVFSLIFALSFSNFIFAIIPESYSISCFLITLCLYYYCRNEKQESAGKRGKTHHLVITRSGASGHHDHQYLYVLSDLRRTLNQYRENYPASSRPKSFSIFTDRYHFSSDRLFRTPAGFQN